MLTELFRITISRGFVVGRLSHFSPLLAMLLA
jgi:hypothetical protein